MISDYQRQSVTLTPAVANTFDAHGQPTAGTPVTLDARVQQTLRMVRNHVGAEVLSRTQIYLAPGTNVNPQDRITYGSITDSVLAVTRAQGLDAESHVVAYL